MGHDVAIVHDYLTQCGGAERVVLAMARAFPGAPIYTSLYVPAATFPEFADHDVRPLWTNRLAALRHDHRRGLPLYPLAYSATSIDAQVTLCSSSGFAHGVRTTGRRVVYCYTPARWLYGQAAPYVAGWAAPVRTALRVVAPALRSWDKRAMARADTVLTSSSAVAAQIECVYGRRAAVVPPPPALVPGGAQRPVEGIEAGFVLCVTRLLAYKNVDAVVDAFAALPTQRLVVVGEGPEHDRLAAQGGTNVHLLGRVDDAQLRWLYAQCSAVVSAAYEDFGLTPVEAASFAKPVAVLRDGGFLDTVVEDRTGVFFDEAKRDAVADALRRVAATRWDDATLRAHAASYDEAAFASRLHAEVDVPPAMITRS